MDSRHTYYKYEATDIPTHYYDRYNYAIDKYTAFLKENQYWHYANY